VMHWHVCDGRYQSCRGSCCFHIMLRWQARSSLQQGAPLLGAFVTGMRF
jgi:hypothetical protein